MNADWCENDPYVEILPEALKLYVLSIYFPSKCAFVMNKWMCYDNDCCVHYDFLGVQLVGEVFLC